MKLPRTRLVPTAAGCFWALAALALVGIAINYANNLTFALAFLLLSIWISAARECFSSLSGLEWLPAPAPSVYAGEALRLSGRVRGPAHRARAPLMLCAGKGKRHIQGVAALADAAREDGATLELALPATARGRQKVAGLRLLALHPLGLWRASRALPDAEALIWPRPAGSLPLPGEAPNPAHKRFEAGDFQDVRAYAPGDPPRRINWRVYGRRGELAVNRFDGGAGGHALWLDIADCTGDVEARLSQLCQWIRDAERLGREYGLRLGGGISIAPGRGRAHQQDCLSRLALHGEETEHV